MKRDLKREGNQDDYSGQEQQFGESHHVQQDQQHSNLLEAANKEPINSVDERILLDYQVASTNLGEHLYSTMLSDTRSHNQQFS